MNSKGFTANRVGRQGLRIAGFAGTTALALSMASAAWGQTSVAPRQDPAPAAPDAAADDIIVTARFRAESNQNTPISITALSGKALEERGIQSVEGIARSAPNVTLEQNTAGYGKSVIAYIRGVGQNDFLPSFEPGVGIYFDNVYMGTAFGSLFDFTDISQIEILRGPQGTLFGKNNEGGAVQVTTRKAKGDGSGYVEAGLGNFNRKTVKAAFDLSVIPDTVFLRVSGGFNKIDGYVDTIDFACANPTLAGSIPRQVPQNSSGSCKTGTTGGDQAAVVRGNLRILPTNGLEININADLLDNTGQAGAEKLIAVNTAGTSPLALYQAGGPGGTNPTGYGNGVYFDQRFITNNRYSTYANFTDSRSGLTYPNASNVRSWGVSGQVDWNIDATTKLTSITAYRAYNGEFYENWAQAPIHINDNYFKPQHHQFSQELRISGTLTRLIDWTVGGYYYDALTKLNNSVSIPLVGFAFFGPDPVKDRDKSVFAHVILHPTDKLSFEAGGRYSDVSKNYQFYRYLPNTGNPPATLPGFQNNPSVLSTTKRFDYRFSAQYKFTPAVMAYAVVATGFKGPGVNPRPSSAAEILPFGEENLRSYEVGLKTELFNRKLRMSIDAYQSDYSNLQLTVTRVLPSGVPGSITANAGKARIRGFEGELTAQPIRNLDFNASVGYLDFRYINLGDAANQPGGPCLSCTTPYVPKWSLSAGVQYKVGLANNGSLTPRLDYAYKSKVYSDASNYEPGAIPGYGLWNARLAYDSPTNDWSLAVQVQNLANKYYFVNKFQGYFALGTLVGQPARPRTVLATLRYNFH